MSATVRASRVCKMLLEHLDEVEIPVQVHSCFQKAVNLFSPLGLITLLSPSKYLQPFSVVLEHPIDFHQLSERRLSISRAGLYENEAKLISIEGAFMVDLQMQEETPPIQSVQILRRFLEGHTDMGLVSLAFQQNGNLYAEFLSPRFMSFREAVWSGDRGAAAYAARRMAGCGPGLTPSSDDLLCGYIAAMPKEMKKTGYASAIAQSAAAETNDISSSLLTWSGKNFFAESILALKNCLCFGPDEAVQLALQRVADFGHSSGYDFLTGFYFGLLDTYKNGGMRIEEARSSQKYLL